MTKPEQGPVCSDDAPPELRTFGRRRGRKLSPKQQALLDELLPRIAIDMTRPAGADQLGPTNHELSDQELSDHELSDQELWLEVGFGGAEHLLWQAEHNPHVRLIGCEPFEDGVVKALTGIEQRGLGNIRLHADDARPLIRWLPTASLARCFILYPDPWPKRRHIKRRLVSPAILAALARIMRPGAELRIGTDIGDYARTVLLAMAASPHFAWQATSAADWRVRPPDWPQTRYEAKAVREGRRSTYLLFRRTAAP